jgi:threonine/homoserine/homoserine lactone efflux protein
MEDGRGGSCRKGGRRAPIGFLEAAAFQCVNPKAWLYCAGVIGGFLESHGPAPTIQPATLSLVTVAIGVPCMLVWLGLGTAMQRLVRTDRALRNFNGGMGLCSQPQPSRWCSRVVFPFTGFAW